MSMYKNLFLLMIILVPCIFAATCEPGFSDPVSVQVLDAGWRPVQNATITFTYQRDETTGKGYVTTAPLQTNSEGRVSTVLHNTEQLASRVRCDIKINATFDGVTKTKTITAQHHLSEEQFQLDAYSLTLHAIDKYGAALANNSVRANQQEGTTDSRGLAYFTVNRKTNVEVAVVYRGSVITKSISVQNDTYYTLQALLYNFELNVVDDSSNPLEAEITVDNDHFSSSSVSISDTPVARPSVSVTYGTLTKNPQIDLSQRESYTVVFDLTPPDITNVQVNMTPSKDMRIKFDVTDPNQLASGPSLDDTVVTYTIGGTTRTTAVYVEGGKYVAEITRPPANSLVRFTILTKDKEGNMKTVEGEYLVQSAQPGNQTTPPTNQTQPPVNPPSIIPLENPLFLLAAAIVGIALLWVVYNYIRGLGSGE
ncbi:MAG: hypothetical protein NTY83_03815 [Candidatus Micrarchaeota archaeon]|nr:hypothetical protein [Candidatus Micrarchaeota archaeon]